jgi:hypothetical protein
VTPLQELLEKESIKLSELKEAYEKRAENQHSTEDGWLIDMV